MSTRCRSENIDWLDSLHDEDVTFIGIYTTVQSLDEKLTDVQLNLRRGLFYSFASLIFSQFGGLALQRRQI